VKCTTARSFPHLRLAAAIPLVSVAVLKRLRLQARGVRQCCACSLTLSRPRPPKPRRHVLRNGGLGPGADHRAGASRVQAEGCG
jgi:hypothetical protein